MRKKRAITETGIYHIYQQANSRIIIFYDNQDKDVFLKCVARSAKKFATEIYAYVVMDNHWHILAKTHHLSDFVTNYMVSYVKWYNFKQKKSGNLCNGPFSSSPKINLVKVLDCVKYILNNPVKSHIVRHPFDYSWSSANQYYNYKINNNSLLKINDSVVKLYFNSIIEFENFLISPSGDLDDFREEKDLGIKVTYSQLAEKLKSILKEKSLSEISREELVHLIRIFAFETNATYIQLANLFQVSYTFIKNTVATSDQPTTSGVIGQ